MCSGDWFPHRSFGHLITVNVTNFKQSLLKLRDDTIRNFRTVSYDITGCHKIPTYTLEDVEISNKQGKWEKHTSREASWEYRNNLNDVIKLY